MVYEQGDMIGMYININYYQVEVYLRKSCLLADFIRRYII